ncbi:MAG TPA: YccF domain-containing protein [Candidatus Scubalenecus merdavium]|uniref:YccF domain-containing protein n=1 Tax=Candidatus Scybalenecus merdavium TaxID=2840939 RepID=A0A9D1SNF8_9FIRM|nr:YccF domain-containing protein [Candidatus Scubalenecus merdavium]
MKTLGNILWFIFGGFETAVCWFFLGVLWCITIVGIPLGKQCFKLASLTIFPFKKDVVDGGGAISLVANIFWVIFTGLPMAITNALVGLVLCITIIGIPFGKQYFKLAALSFAPFGKEIVRAD